MSTVTLRDANDPAVFGGKAVQLGAALRAGLPVPDGLAVAAATVESIVQGDAAGKAEFCRQVSTLPGPLAIRSSAIGEDSAEASFAGQHTTKLNVVGIEATLAALEDVWQSGRTEAALSYRQRMGLGMQADVAVVVQCLVAADVAGVLFTRNPLTGSDEIVVEAGWGLGESIVQGLVVPDRFRMTRTGQVLERTAGNKGLAVQLASTGGTVQEHLPPNRSRRLCLSYGDLARLTELAAQCEHVFGAEPHDIEWAIRDGQLYLLQRRPITRVAKSTQS